MNEINVLFDVTRRRWWVILIVCAIGISLMPNIGSIFPAFKSTAELLIISEASKDTTSSDPNLPSIITSTEVLDRVIKRLKLDTDPAGLAGRIKTKLPAKSSILDLTYKDTDRIRAADVANAIAEEAASYYHEIALRGYTDVIKALDEKVRESRAQIAAADMRLHQFSAKNAFASSDKALDDLTTQITELEAQRGQISVSLAADRATTSALQRQLQHISPIVRGEILQKDVVYQQLETGFGKDVADLISERSSFHDSFPGLAALGGRVDRERQHLKSLASTVVANGVGLSPSFTQTVLDAEHSVASAEADAERLRTTDAELADAKSHLRQVAGAGASVGTLRAERDASVQQYMTLTQRLGTAEGDAAQAASLGTLVVVSRAIPGKSTLSTYMLAAAALIVLLAIGAAYCVDSIDRRFWGTREMENTYGRPVLVEVGGH